MAIERYYNSVKEKYIPEYWDSFEEFEEYYLIRVSETSDQTNHYTNKEGVVIPIKPINHFPELKEYEVWSEGYCTTGQDGTALFHGKAKARNFGQACHIVMCTEKLKHIAKQNNPNNPPNPLMEDCHGSRWDYNPSKFNVWSCGLYWSKELASKSFG